MSNSGQNISPEEIVELQKKFSEIKSATINALAVMMARADRGRRVDFIKKGDPLTTDIETRLLLSEMSQGRSDYSEKLASTVLTKAPQIVSSLQEFTQVLNEKAPPVAANRLQLAGVHPGLERKGPARSISSRVRLSLTRLTRRCTGEGSQKIEKEITIINRLGLDPILAAMFVRIASRFRSEIWVQKEGERINGKSIMGLLMLAAGQGSKLHIRCEGHDADRAMQELEELIRNCLDTESQRREQGPTGLREQFSVIKYAINEALAVMMALSEMSQRRPDYAEKLASTVLTKAPQIVSKLQEFTQALNEKAGPKPEVSQ